MLTKYLKFHLTNTAVNNLPRKSGKHRNYDLFYLYVTGHQSYKSGASEVKCLESVNVGILLDASGYFTTSEPGDTRTDYTSCAALDFL